MKKSIIYSMIAATGVAFTSCGGGAQMTTNPLMDILSGAAGAGGAEQNIAGNATQGLLGNLLSGLLGNLTPVNAAALRGSWTYTSPECRFESENFLTQAGGTMVAGKIEQQLGSTLSKLGFKEGSTTFEFDGNNACTISTGGMPILAGTYTVDPQTRAITIKGTAGLITLSGTVYMTGNTLTLLFDSSKLLGFIKGAGSLLGKNTGVVGQLFDYKGMQMGMNLTR